MLSLRAIPVSAALLILSATIAQTAPLQGKPLTFDAASVKPVKDAGGPVMMRKGEGGPGRNGGPGTSDPGRIHYSSISLINLITNAYDVKFFQVVGPGWLSEEMFNVDATMPPTTTKEQFREMLQNLIIERFKMAVHRETRELPIFALVVGRNGPKLTKSADVPYDSSPPRRPDGPPKFGSDGFPLTPGLARHRGIFIAGNAYPNSMARRLICQQQTMQNLVDRITPFRGRPVEDQTGLTGTYDFTVTFTDDDGSFSPKLVKLPPGSDPLPLPDFSEAIQAQLGLKLEPKNGAVDVIVIDHAEKIPTEN